ncbi:MAG: amino acid permease [Brevefilum sp.]|nr:amino acid permease [Brevefilum sp.]
MAKRKLRRQLSLLQVIMLGTAGTIAAEIFVLTGHAAGIAGPDAVLAIIIGGVLSLSIALNYCELATTYPVTGGAMTYVKEGFGNNLVMFLVGSLDGLSSTFYAALSAVGFAYSLKVFFPFLPIIPIALLVITAVGIMHVRGITQVGNLQIVLGGFLLVVFILYIVLGFTRPGGFTWETFQSGRVLFEDRSIWANLGRMLTTVALIYNAYVGFEVIADDAEEIREPHRVIPKGILISLGVTTLVYTLVSLVTIGVIPYEALAGSETALTDAASVFWPRIGVTLMAAAGIVATLTSVNSAMLSATREAFTLSRDQVWPRGLSRLSRWRTPYAAILMVAVISGLVTIIGLVDFLSFISSAGYMFVLFWASLAMIQLRKKYPDIDRPFKVPFYPLTPILAALSGVLIIAFANPQALLFLGLVIIVLTGVFYISRYYRRRAVVQGQLDEAVGGGRLLIAAINPKTAAGLVELAARLAEHQEDTSITLMSVIKVPNTSTESEIKAIIEKSTAARNKLLALTAPIAQKRNVAISAKIKAANNVESAIYKELQSPNPVGLVILGWPTLDTKLKIPHNIIKEVMVNARQDVVILRNRGFESLKKILVPIAGGPNARLCLHLAKSLVFQPGIHVTALHLTPEGLDEEKTEDALLYTQEIVEEVLGTVPDWMDIQVRPAPSASEGIQQAVKTGNYDLLMIGAGGDVFSYHTIFGTLNDILIETVDCSVLIVRHYQPEAVLWLNKRIHQLET